MLLEQSDVPRSRSEMRLAMRTSHWYSMPPLVPRREQNTSSHQPQGVNLVRSSAEPCYQMEALVPLESGEDDAWLNDVAPPRSKPVPASSEAREHQEIRVSEDATRKTTPSLAGEHTLLCWL